MTFEEFTGHFEVKKRGTNNVQAICPAHDDHQASLTITRGTDRILMHCHAGCSNEDILNRVGLKKSDMFYDDRKSSGKSFSSNAQYAWQRFIEDKEQRKVERAYNYYSIIDGEYVFTKIRMEKRIKMDKKGKTYLDKPFLIGIFNGSKINLKLNGASQKDFLGIYGQQENFKKCIVENKPVFYAEGEKDVDTLQKYGYAAVTCGGAGNWNIKVSKFFSNANLVILADNDDPGKKLAKEVYSDLNGIVKSCKIIIPVKDTLKADITDYFEAGHTVEEFEKMLQQQNDTEEVLNYIPQSNNSNNSNNAQMPSEKDISAIFATFAPIERDLNKVLQSFPVEFLPDTIRTYTEAVAESLQVPVDMVASLILAVLSLCVQGKFYIKVKTDWVESVNLYMIVIGRPSERKSPVLKEIESPIFTYMAEENERRKPEIKKYKLQKKILDGKLKTIQEALAKNRKSNTYTMQDAFDCQEEIDNLEEVKPLMLVMDDTTPEALVEAMKQNEEKMGILSAEGGLFGVMAGRYSNDVNIDVFLKSYSGEYLRLSRIGREGTELQNPYLTIGLAVQPQVISEVMENRNFRGRGLLARFMYSFPNSRVGSRKYRTEPIKDVTRKKYENLCKDLLVIPDLTNFAERVISLSNEADLLSEKYNQWIEERLMEELEPIEDWAGKLHGNTMRIAGILHIVKHKLNSVNVPLEEETMKAAIAIGKYYLEHSEQAFEIMGLLEEQNEKDAKYIMSRIDSKNSNNSKIQEISKRDVFNLCKGRFKKVDDMEPGLECLIEHGYITAFQEEAKGTGRPSTRIFINPEYYQWKEQQKKNRGTK